MAPTQAYSLFGPNSPFWTASRNSVTSAYRTYNHTRLPCDHSLTPQNEPRPERLGTGEGKRELLADRLVKGLE